MIQPIRISVIGAGAGQASPQDEADAFEIGTLLAGRATLITGGRGGVMEAACRGAAQAGGIAVGLLPGDERQANAFVNLAIPTGIGEARNVLVVSAGHGVIAVGGSYGTLSEIGFALKLGSPLVGLHTWSVTDPTGSNEHYRTADSPSEAVDLALRLVNQSRGGDRGGNDS